MGKIKDLIMSWREMYNSGIPMEWSFDTFNWFDATEQPEFNDGKWYREKNPPAKKPIDGDYNPPKDYA